jgi:hypothetical protein
LVRSASPTVAPPYPYHHATSSSSLPSLSPHSHPGGASGWRCRCRGRVSSRTRWPRSSCDTSVQCTCRARTGHARRIDVAVGCDPASDAPSLPLGVCRLARCPRHRPLCVPSKYGSSVAYRELRPRHTYPRTYCPPHHVIPAFMSRTQAARHESEIGTLLFVRRNLSLHQPSPSLRMIGKEMVAHTHRRGFVGAGACSGAW